MQDYARLYPSRFRKVAESGKLKQIRRLLLSGLPPEVMLLLIAAVVLPRDVVDLFRK